MINRVYRKLKLYRIATVLRYIRESWPNSAFVKQQCPSKNRLCIYFDLIYWYLFYGNDFNDYCTFSFWNKTSAERKQYISFRRNSVLGFEFSSQRAYRLFLDKAAFNARFEKYVKRRWITTLGKSFEEIVSFIDRQGNVICKPLDAACGRGVFKVNRTANDYDAVLKWLEDSILRGGVFVIEEVIENHEQLRRLAPGCLNTVRVVTVIDNRGELQIVAALLRMGDGTGITDNYHNGGMACPIDIGSSKLTGVAYGQNCTKFTSHPFSKLEFEGYEVPQFGRCLDVIREIAYYEPEARYVGWDLAITPDGIEIIEGNIPPGEDITQTYTGYGLWPQMQQWK